MCGIVGLVSPSVRPEDVARVQLAMDSIAHRGPDASGIETRSRAVFGHRRLSVIDIEGSHQPLVSVDGRYTLIFNGEIYNYVELRAELKAQGVEFSTQGDTEVVLALLARVGVAALDRMNGMFAFAFWDDHERRLLLARDRVGKKPLYYTQKNGVFAFASELGGLLAMELGQYDVDATALRHYFSYQYVGQGRSMLAGIERLPPGSYLTGSFESDEFNTRSQRYWQLASAQGSARGGVTGRDWVAELDALLADSIRLRLRSDAKLGVFLSGGVDSALIAARTLQADPAINLFTLGFADPSFDESADAQATARALGANTQTVFADSSAPVQLVVDALRSLSEPLADPSAIAVWLLSRHMSKHIKVALSGDGGDELFGGYRRYSAVMAYSALNATGLRGLPNVVRACLPRPASGRYMGNDRRMQLALFAEMCDSGARYGDFRLRTFTRAALNELLGVAQEPFAQPTSGGREPLLERTMLDDICNYLPEDLLVKADRMGMAHGLEIRAPLLDYRIVEFSQSVPLDQKLGWFTGRKRILKTLASQHLPNSVLSRPKHGFSVPVALWLRAGLKDYAMDTIQTALPHTALNAPMVRCLLDEHMTGRADHGMRLWSVLVYCEWATRYRRWIRT